MFNIDREIIIKNIERLIGDMPQEELGEKIGMGQSNISQCMNRHPKGKARTFTLEQLARIATEFNTSIDNLVGLSGGTKTNDVTLYNAMTCLLQLDEVCDLEIEIEESEYGSVCPHIKFRHNAINNFLKDWKKTRTFKEEELESGGNIFEIWKADALRKGNNQYRKWDYFTPLEEADRLVDIIVRNASLKHTRVIKAYSSNPTPLIRANMEGIKEIRGKDYDYDKLSSALDYIDDLRNDNN